MKKRFKIAILASRFVVKSTLTVASRGAKSNPFALQYTGFARLPTLILWAYFFGRCTDFFNRDVTLSGGIPGRHGRLCRRCRRCEVAGRHVRTMN